MSWPTSHTNHESTTLHKSLINIINETAFVVKSHTIDQSVLNINTSRGTVINSAGPYANNNAHETTLPMQNHNDNNSAIQLVGFVFHKTSISISVILVLWVS